VSPSFRRGHDGDDWGRRHRSSSRFRLFYGYPYYGYGLYDPWYYGFGGPYGYGYGSPYAYSYPQDCSSPRCEAAYNLGLYDALSGRPQHYVKGETPGYRGKCRDAYNAGYAEGLVEQVRKGEGGRYAPPKEYVAPSEVPPPPEP